MDKNNIFKTGKALLFITSSLLLSDACFGIHHSIFSPDEDEILRNSVEAYIQAGYVLNWVEIAKGLPGRTAKQCRNRWTLILDPTINKGPWEPEEDKILIEGVEAKHGWTAIARELGLDKTGKHRTGQQCQNRYERRLKDRAPQPQVQADQAPANSPLPPPPPVQPAKQTLPLPILSINPPQPPAQADQAPANPPLPPAPAPSLFDDDIWNITSYGDFDFDYGDGS